MQIKRPVAVIAIVTEAFKADLIREITESIEEVTANMQALDTQARRYLLQLQSADLTQSAAFRKQVEVEKAKQEQVRTELKQRLDEVNALPIDGEYPRGTLESFVDLKKGDNLIERIGRAEIIVKDDIILEIRGE